MSEPAACPAPGAIIVEGRVASIARQASDPSLPAAYHYDVVLDEPRPDYPTGHATLDSNTVELAVGGHYRLFVHHLDLTYGAGKPTQLLLVDCDVQPIAAPAGHGCAHCGHSDSDGAGLVLAVGVAILLRRSR